MTDAEVRQHLLTNYKTPSQTIDDIFRLINPTAQPIRQDTFVVILHLARLTAKGIPVPHTIPQSLLPYLESIQMPPRLPLPQPLPEHNDIPPSRTLHVSNFPYDTTEAELASFFSVPVSNVTIIYKGHDKTQSAGYGYIQMDSVELATKAMQRLHNSNFGNRRIFIHYSRTDVHDLREHPQHSGTRLFIGNVNYSVTVPELKNHIFYGSHVPVLQATIPLKYGKPGGYAFITVSNLTSANEVIKSLNGIPLKGRPLRISLADAQQPQNPTHCKVLWATHSLKDENVLRVNANEIVTVQNYDTSNSWTFCTSSTNQTGYIPTSYLKHLS